MCLEIPTWVKPSGFLDESQSLLGKDRLAKEQPKRDIRKFTLKSYGSIDRRQKRIKCQWWLEFSRKKNNSKSMLSPAQVPPSLLQVKTQNFLWETTSALWALSMELHDFTHSLQANCYIIPCPCLTRANKRQGDSGWGWKAEKYACHCTWCCKNVSFAAAGTTLQPQQENLESAKKNSRSWQ